MLSEGDVYFSFKAILSIVLLDQSYAYQMKCSRQFGRVELQRILERRYDSSILRSLIPCSHLQPVLARLVQHGLVHCSHHSELARATDVFVLVRYCTAGYLVY